MRRGSSKGRSPNRKPSGKKDESRRRSPPKRATKGGTAKATNASRASASSTRSKSDAARLAKELAEARARQDATSEILRAISRSSSDAQPVFHAIVLAAVRLLGCDNAYCLRCDATTFSTVAIAGPQGLIEPRSAASLAIDPNTNFPSRAIVSRKNLYLPDWSKIDLPPFERELQKIRRVNSSLYLPLLRGEECIGVLALASRRADNFDARDIALAESFRDQALIAVENARLFHETKESLARQTAMAQVLEVINNSPGDLKPVFDAILERATRLCGAGFGVLSLYKGDDWHQVVAMLGEPPGFADMYRDPIHLGPETGVGRLLRGESYVQIADAADDDAYRSGHPVRRALVDIAGARTYLAVPIRRDDVMLGSFTIYRREVRLFSSAMIALLQSFAAQAAIAIENARLFNETQEALERQTATADILKVIARSPDDVQPVFEAIAERANRLVGGHEATVLRIVGDMFHLAAFTPIGEEADAVLRASFPMRVDAGVGFESVQRGAMSEIGDTESEAFALTNSAKLGRARGFRSRLMVPLKSDSGVVGAISVTRVKPGRFDPHHVQLLQTFADQAVIAIQNARLFNETREALERQTATADILKVIASSPDNVQPVFEAIVTSAARVIGAFSAGVFRYVDGLVHLAAMTSVSPAGDDVARANFPRPIGDFHLRTAQTGEVVQVADTEDQPNARLKEIARARGYRSILYVPLRSSGTSIGAIAVTRQTTGLFAAHHVELLQTFADQAVIAIENVRLFNETKESLQRQTATADILRVIASSPSDVQPVFEAIAEESNRLLNGLSTAVFSLTGDVLNLMAYTRVSPAADASLAALFPRPLSTLIFSETIRRGDVHFIADCEVDYAAHPGILEAVRLRGWRSALYVPLLRDGKPIGMISVTRVEPGVFAPNHVELLKTFADQAVIAIENARLFNEVQARTRDLTESLEQQTATAEILSSISGSMHDTKPVFEAIVRNLLRLFGTRFAVVQTLSDGVVEMPAADGEPGFERLTQQYPRPLARDTAGSLAMLEKRTVQFQPVLGNPAAPVGTQGFARSFGFDSVLFTPMLSGDKVVGAIGVARHEAIPFDSKQIALITSFANQAVIAIENTRLLGELRQRTDDLGEALQQQTATADVLKVISRSTFDLEAVLKTLTESAVGLCRAARGAVFLRDGDVLRVRANAGTAQEFIDFLDANPIVPSRQTFTGRTFLSGEITHLPDVLADPEYDFGPAPRIGQYRSALGVPLLRQGRVEGVFSVSRPEPGGFTDREIELIRTFADQAVIAIENVRLFNETQEALERQTATSEILRVISSSSGDLQPVFKAILANALKICGAAFGNLLLFDGTGFEAAELHTAPPAYGDLFRDGRLVPPPSTALGRMIATKRVVHIPDVVAEDGGVEDSPLRVATIRILEARTLLAVPMLRDDELVGAIVIYRQEARPFNDKQIELVTNFADQAVIAIENARLLNELRMRTEELSRSLDDLRAAQDRLVQTEKLASLGQLTAGIAHEIKNPLNFVNNFSALSAELTDELNDLLKGAALTEKMREEVGELTKLLQDNLQKVVQHGQRADSIVKNMLLHSREGSGEQRLADVNALVDESLNLAYHGARAEKFGFNITLQRDFDTGAGTAELFPQEITRALLNLISNGFYAATRRGTENGEAGFEPTLLATTKDLGSAVEIRIRDNGAGIPPEVKEKIFNPFFTTKPAGEGTGLGLSMTHDIIVKQHGGRIEVATEPGEFTEFVIVLPRTANSRKTDRR